MEMVPLEQVGELNNDQRAYLLEVLRQRLMAVALLVTLLHRRLQRRLRRRRRIWVREWIQRRDRGRGALNMVHVELRLEDADSYRNYLRMDVELFEELLAIVGPHIQKQDTVMRQAISPRSRLAATLRFLASGNTFVDLSYAVRIPHNTLSKIIPETMRAIVLALQDEFVKCPDTRDEWLQIEEGFRTMWNFPHCVGALDGKHINFRPPRTAGSFFRNYKGRDSIVLLALVDAKYKFLYLDVGRNGRMNDGAVFRDSEFGQALRNNNLNLPDPSPLPGYIENLLIPYVITADDAFPLSVNLMKPFPSRGLTYEERIFNYRLSRSRRIVENAFGILANRFRVLLTTINLSVDKVQLITITCCVLHNFILTRRPILLRNIDGEDYTANDSESHCPLLGLGHQGGNNATQTAKNVRCHFKHYFNGVGAVPWQNDAVMRGNY